MRHWHQHPNDDDIGKARTERAGKKKKNRMMKSETANEPHDHDDDDDGEKMEGNLCAKEKNRERHRKCVFVCVHQLIERKQVDNLTAHALTSNQNAVIFTICMFFSPCSVSFILWHSGLLCQ